MEPGRDDESVHYVAQAIEEAGTVSKAISSEERHERGDRASAALDKVIDMANARLRD